MHRRSTGTTAACALAFALGLILSVHTAVAGEIYWDLGSTDFSGAVDPPYPGDGYWHTAANWRANNSSPHTPPNNDVLPVAGDRATIALQNTSVPAPAEITTGDNIQVSAIRLGSNPGLGVGGQGILNITGGSLTVLDTGTAEDFILGADSNRRGTVDLSGGGSVNVDKRLIISNANNTSVFTVSDAASSLTVGGLTEISNAGTGQLVVNDGTVDLNGGVQFGNNNGLVELVGGTTTVTGDITGGVGTVRVDGGALNVTGTTIDVDQLQVGQIAGRTGSFTLQSGQTLTTANARVLLGEAGTGTFIQQAGSTVEVGTGSAQNLVVGGNNASGQGTYTIEGGDLTVHQDINVGNVTSAASTFDQQNGAVATDRDIQLAAGSAGSGHGTYLLKDGTLQVADDVRIGVTSSGVGIFTQSGGTATVGDNVEMALAGGTTATLTLSGGTMNVAGDITDGPGTSKINIRGGTLNMTGGGSVAVDELDVGNGDDGSLGIDSDWTVGGPWRIGVGGDQGTVTQTAGTVNHTAAELNVGQNGAGGGIYNMQGGTLNANGGFAFRVGASAAGTFEHTGGAVNVGASGFLIGGNSVGVYNLSGTGQLTRTGDEVLGNNTAAKGTVNQSGGTHHITRDLLIANNASANNFGKFNISGGSLDVDRDLLLGAVAGATGTLTVVGPGPASINVDGDFLQNDTSTLAVVLQSTAPHLETIEVGGVAELDGILEVQLDSFLPDVDQTFDVLHASEVTLGPSFTLTQPGGLSPGQMFTAQVIGSAGDQLLQLTFTVPEPAAALLAALGGLALMGMFIRRRSARRR